MKKLIGLLLDTETCNLMDCPLLYDLAFAVIDLHRNILAKFRIILTDVFHGESELMKSAYYASKLPQYYEAIRKGEVLTMDIWEIKHFLKDICDHYGVTFAAAHNARFDYLSTNNTIRYLTKSKARYLLPYGVEWWDTMKMADSTICKQPTYKKFCEENGYLMKSGKPRRTAEILYRYITKDNEFTEEHTALSDVLIECEIFWKCFEQHKRMDRKLWADRG
jgi:DNA polymerase III epsilon subunit-like protein